MYLLAALLVEIGTKRDGAAEVNVLHGTVGGALDGQEESHASRERLGDVDFYSAQHWNVDPSCFPRGERGKDAGEIGGRGEDRADDVVVLELVARHDLTNEQRHGATHCRRRILLEVDRAADGARAHAIRLCVLSRLTHPPPPSRS
jgi:hypothetical protein